MSRNPMSRVVIALFLVILLAVPLALVAFVPSVDADDDDPMLRPSAKGPDSAKQALTTNELEQLVAPVALYPDKMLGVVLDACKSPHALVMASDYTTASNGTKSLNDAWPQSVKTLLAFPNVLLNLDGNLGWATRLGHAQHFQARDLKAVVQFVRQGAKEAGNLESSDRLKVVVEDKRIEILAVDPDNLYIPWYDPASIYVAPDVRGGPLMSFHDGIDLHDVVAHHRYLHGAFPHYRWSAGPAHPVRKPKRGLNAMFDPNFGHLNKPHPEAMVRGEDDGRVVAGEPDPSAGYPGAEDGNDDGWVYGGRRYGRRVSRFRGGAGFGRGGRRR